MPRRRPPRPARTHDEAIFARAHSRRAVPFAFVLDAIADLEPMTRPMFGCMAVYVDERIVFVLRDRADEPDDNGVWIATTRDHHASYKRELPCMRSIRVLAGGAVTGWQNLPADALGFEEAALRACELVSARDPRIGKVPERRDRRRRAAPDATE
jgi:hypothetical protein